jgi:hypothetical protein
VKRYLWMFLLLIVSSPAGATHEDWREQSEKVLDATGVKGIVVENARGFVEVRPSTDDRIHLTALKLIRGTDPDRSRALAQATEVRASDEGGRFEVRVRYPQRQQVRIDFWDMLSGHRWPRLEVRLALEVPRDLPVRLSSSSGDLVTADLVGPQELTTTSGDISLDGGRAKVAASSTSGTISAVDLGVAELRTVSGDIEVSEVRGRLRASTTSGGILVQGALDSLLLGSVSGDLRVTRAPRGVTARTVSGEIGVNSAGGTVELESTSGDVSLWLDPGVRGARVTTASGDIVVGLRSPVGCALELSTSNGTLDASVPLEVTSVSRRFMTGVVRGGDVPVLLKSSSGDISVRSGGE